MSQYGLEARARVIGAHELPLHQADVPAGPLPSFEHRKRKHRQMKASAKVNVWAHDLMAWNQCAYDSFHVRPGAVY